MAPKYHIVDNGFVNQISNLDKAGQSRHQAEDRHGNVSRCSLDG